MGDFFNKNVRNDKSLTLASQILKKKSKTLKENSTFK